MYRLFLLLLLSALPACGPAGSPDRKPEPATEERTKPAEPSAEESAKRASQAHTEAKALAGYVEQFNLDHDQYPATLDDLAQPPPGKGKPYVPAEKLNDPWGKKYQVAFGMDAMGKQLVMVSTTAPDGTRISNFGITPPAKKK